VHEGSETSGSYKGFVGGPFFRPGKLEDNELSAMQYILEKIGITEDVALFVSMKSNDRKQFEKSKKIDYTESVAEFLWDQKLSLSTDDGKFREEMKDVLLNFAPVLCGELKIPGNRTADMPEEIKKALDTLQVVYELKIGLDGGNPSGLGSSSGESGGETSDDWLDDVHWCLDDWRERVQFVLG